MARTVGDFYWQRLYDCGVRAAGDIETNDLLRLPTPRAGRPLSA
jgi:hypothetical protein